MKKIFIFTLCMMFFYTVSSFAAWNIDSLSAAYSGLASTRNGTKALFASNSKFEIYDFVSGTWSTHNMNVPRPAVLAATAGTKSYFAGGGYITVNTYNFYKQVDIYNSANNMWSVANLSVERIVGGAAAIGNKVLFAGGRQILNYSNRVDIFNVNTGARTTHTLSQGRHNMAVAVVGTKVIFAGGETGDITMGQYITSNRVDIYDNATGTWSTALLSTRRQNITAAVAGNKALFAGGYNSNGVMQNIIDVYDASTNTWSTLNLSEPKYGMTAATVGNKVYFVGGLTANSGILSNKVEIFNMTNNVRNVITLSSGRMGMAVGRTYDRLMFAGGITVWGNTGTDRVEVLDLTTYTWSVEYLSRPRLALAAVSYTDKAVFAGGAEVWSSYPQFSVISKRVDIWTDPFPREMAESGGWNNQPVNAFKVYPNPFRDMIAVEIPGDADQATAFIFDITGRQVSSYILPGGKKYMDLSELKSGIYFLRLSVFGIQEETIRIIKE